MNFLCLEKKMDNHWRSDILSVPRLQINTHNSVVSSSVRKLFVILGLRQKYAQQQACDLIKTKTLARDLDNSNNNYHWFSSAGSARQRKGSLSFSTKGSICIYMRKAC